MRIANIIFEECGTASNIVSLDLTCQSGESSNDVHLHYVEFRDNVLSEDKWLIESANPSCTHLALQNIDVVKNRCASVGCISLASVNNLTDVRLKRNSAATSATVSQGVFNSSVGSDTTATRISATRNQIKIFNVFNGTLSISDSLFRGNRASDSSSLNYLSNGGSVLLSNQSRLTITNCSFEENSGQNGGALFVVASQFNMLNCTLGRNIASEGNGGAITARYGSTVVIVGTDFYNNEAPYGGACDFEQSEVTMRNLIFQSNVATNDDGGAVHNSGGVIMGESLRFVGNHAASRSGALQFQYTPRVVLSNIEFQNNTGSFGGAIGASNSEIELRPPCSFTTNHVIHDGGSINLSNSAASITSCYFHSNSADAGGSMWLGGGSRSSIENSSFINETVELNGGAIHLSQSSSMNASGSRFSGNHHIFVCKNVLCLPFHSPDPKPSQEIELKEMEELCSCRTSPILLFQTVVLKKITAR